MEFYVYREDARAGLGSPLAAFRITRHDFRGDETLPPVGVTDALQVGFQTFGSEAVSSCQLRGPTRRLQLHGVKKSRRVERLTSGERNRLDMEQFLLLNGENQIDTACFDLGKIVRDVVIRSQGAL